jgi:hypothetical protein
MTDREREQERSKIEDEIRKLSREQLNEAADAASAGVKSVADSGEQRKRGKRIEEFRRQLADIYAGPGPTGGS